MAIVLGCGRGGEAGDGRTARSAETMDSADPAGPSFVAVTVRLDGIPAAATVYVGGDPAPHPTDASGTVSLWLSPADSVIASHPAARTEGASVGDGPVEVDLETIDPADNEAYVFQDPGNPDDAGDTGKCAHCHETIVAAWFASPHRTSASNPHVQDVYEEARADLAGATGGCADCHAPGIDGALGGRDLGEATGLALDYGVHCDVCHKVDEVDLSKGPGVSGALRIHRPIEPTTLSGFTWRPLTFGPYDDVPNPRMGSASRELFHEAELCGACHELWQGVLLPGAAADPTRWPDGRLPIHTTFSEWQGGPYSPSSPCQSCHMPPDPEVGNSADLGNVFDIPESPAGGWYRPPGSVRRHSWPGPRQPELGLLALAAAIDLETTIIDGTLEVRATVTNAGCGHALPTGEPLRAVLLVVEASCDGDPLVATGGAVLPDWAGAYDSGPVGTTWPGAIVGDRIRVVRRPGGFVDYPGFGPFGDGTFDAEEKGLPIETWAGESVVVGVSGDEVTLDRPLPAGELAYRVPAVVLPADGDPIRPLAGAPGFAFARVLVDADGIAMVPHHRAVDVRSDDRLLPQASWTSIHAFAAPCAEPEVHAVVLHRPLPWALAVERGFTVEDAVIAEVRR